MYLSRGARQPAFLPRHLSIAPVDGQVVKPSRLCVGQASPLLPASARLTGPSSARLVRLVQQDSALLPHAHLSRASLLPWGTCSLKKHLIELGPCPGDERSIPETREDPLGRKCSPL